jgi:glutamate-ammonia-ligase adenylyltransferase
MIDLEFAVQFLVLAHSHEHPELTKNLGNIALLKLAADFSLIDSETADRARNAYREYRRIQHGLRLNGAQYARVEAAKVAAEIQAVKQWWDGLFSSRGA